MNTDTDTVTIRRATDADAHSAADVWLRSFKAALPSVKCAHSDDEVHAWFADVLVPQQETWVAVADSGVVGVMVLHGEEMKQLFLDPGWRGRGLGDRFMALANSLVCRSRSGPPPPWGPAKPLASGQA